MILRRLQAECIKRHIAPVEVVFGEHLTVIEGGNETGKSTLFTALEYAFFRRSSGTGADIDALKPWQTAGVKPRILVDFAYEGAEYRLEKNWSGGGTTVISKFDARGKPITYMTEGADDWLVGLFAGESGGPGFRAIKSTHLGLAHLLFARQGRVVNRMLSAGDTELNANAQARLSSIVGAVAQTEGETDLVDDILRQFKEFWTTGGGRGLAGSKLKTNVESKLLTKDLESKRLELQAAEKERDSFTDIGKKYELESEKLKDHRIIRDQGRADFERLLPELRKAAAAKQELQEAESDTRAQKTLRDEVLAKLSRIDDVESQREIHVAMLQPKHAEYEAARENHARAIDAATAAQQRFVSAAAQDLVLEQTRTNYAVALRAQTDRIELQQLTKAIESVDTCDAKLATIAAPPALPVVTSANLTQLREILERRKEIQAELRRAKMTLTVQALAPLTLEQEAGTHPLRIGESANMTGTDVTFTLSDLATVTARGPQIDITELHSEELTLATKLTTFERKYGSVDYDVLVSWKTREERRQAEVERLQRERSLALDGRDMTVVKATITDLLTRLEQAAELKAPGELSQLVERLSEARELAIKMANDEHTAKRELLVISQQNLSDAERALNEAKRHVHDDDATMLELLGNKTRPEIESLRDAIEEAWLRADFRERIARESYAPYDSINDPFEEIERLQRVRDASQEFVDEAERTVAALRERFERLQGMGLAAAISELSESISRCEAAINRANIDEQAIFLLHSIVTDVLGERSASLAQPIELLVAPWYERVTGAPITRVVLGDHNELRGLRLADVDREIQIDELSSGAADQLGILIRLAFAQLLSSTEPLPTLLDDPLVNADPLRRNAMLSILNEVARRTQIIIFTCRIEDYLSSGATIARILDPAERRDKLA